MTLLSTLAAHDLGYLTTGALIRRIDSTLTTLEGLERYEGHVLNWYDTATLAPLQPRYVSTVDSGNFAAALIALAQGLIAVAASPQTRRQLLEGLIDSADLLSHASSTAPAEASSRDAITRINRLAREIASHARRELDGEAAGSFGTPANELAQIVQLLSVPGIAPAQPSDVAFWAEAVSRSVAALSTPSAETRSGALTRLAERASAIAAGMRFDFL